jgi:hypothetical protein
LDVIILKVTPYLVLKLVSRYCVFAQPSNQKAVACFPAQDRVVALTTDEGVVIDKARVSGGAVDNITRPLTIHPVVAITTYVVILTISKGNCLAPHRARRR